MPNPLPPPEDRPLDSGTPGVDGPALADESVADESRSRRRRLPAVLAAFVLVPLLTVLGVAGVVYATTPLPDPDDVQQPQLSILEFSDGSELGRVGAENRVEVPLSEVSQAAQLAVLSAEQRDYYDEPGISPRGILRALRENLRSGEVVQGGSTITQQYAKNAFLSSDQTLSRKLREVALAVKLDRSTSKEEVLERYLNTVFFGRDSYGIQVAARTWFGKPASELTAAEGAVLAAQLRAPSQYDPAVNPELARDRWEFVVDGMAERGWLDEPRAQLAYPQVRDRADRRNSLGGTNGYLMQMAVEELERLGIREQRVNVEGLRIRTTFHRGMQDAAVAAVREVSGEQLPDGVQRALVTIEPGTGRVLALYGGPDFVSRPFNSATQGVAQAGSAFKPFVLATALQQGISLRTRYDGSSPQTFDGDYEVKNFGPGAGQQFGRIDLVEATASSVNTVYVPLGIEAGLGDVADLAADLGITADMSTERSLPSLSLGVTAVHPIDVANAYATLAAGGLRATPFVVEEVRDGDGDVLLAADPVNERVLDEAVAADTTFALEQTVARGTGRGAALPGRPAAGKTGTTSGSTAAWFAGYTPGLATAAALFTEQQDTGLPSIAGVGSVTGGSLPAATFGRFMTAVLDGQPVRPLPDRADVGDVPSPPPPPTRPAREPAPAPPPIEQRPPAPTRAPAPPPSATAPPPAEEPEPTEPTEPEPTEPAPTEPTEPEPTEPAPTEPEPTEPEPTEPEPDPAPTQPEPTEPEPDPEPTEPEPAPEPEPDPEPTDDGSEGDDGGLLPGSGD